MSSFTAIFATRSIDTCTITVYVSIKTFVLFYFSTKYKRDRWTAYAAVVCTKIETAICQCTQLKMVAKEIQHSEKHSCQCSR